MKEKRKKSGADILLTVLLVIAIGIFIFAGYQLLHIYLEYKQGVDEYNSIAEMVVTENPDVITENPSEPETEGDLVDFEADPQEEAEPSIVPPMSIDFDSLLRVNTDVIGWIYVEALPDINYPVVKGTDNSYYLHKTYTGEDNFAGTIFIDYENARDFSDCNTLVYGHNMKNGSMFGSLKKFTSDPEVYKSSKYFWIFTPEASYRYEIISAYVTAVDSDTYTLFSGPGQQFEEWLHKIVSRSALDEKTDDLSMDDKIVTLSTCTGNSATRYVVQGKRVDTVETTDSKASGNS